MGPVEGVAISFVVTCRLVVGIHDEGVPQQIVQLREVGSGVGAFGVLITDVFALFVLADTESTVVDVA